MAKMMTNNKSKLQPKRQGNLRSNKIKRTNQIKKVKNFKSSKKMRKRHNKKWCYRNSSRMNNYKMNCKIENKHFTWRGNRKKIYRK